MAEAIQSNKLTMKKPPCNRRLIRSGFKTMVHDFARSSQAPHIVFQHNRDHRDEQVLAIQNHIEEQYSLRFNPEQLSRKHGMSRRAFERRFKKATGHTPIFYLQRSRVEAAKQMPETGLRSFDEIAYKVGYEDSSFFRKVFVKLTGLRPSEYKAKFNRGYHSGNAIASDGGTMR